MNSPERRRKVVSDWMSVVISSMYRLPPVSTLKGAGRIHYLVKYYIGFWSPIVGKTIPPFSQKDEGEGAAAVIGKG